MLYRNRELDRAFTFIANSEFDVFCLQEVPEAFLARLHTLPYHLASHIEVDRLLPSGIAHTYGVILSKNDITSKGEIPFDEYWSQLPLRTRLFVHLMPSRFFSKIRNRSGLFVDILQDGQSLRVFNLHLVLAQPAWRLAEFERAMEKRNTEQSTIVCGDFNIIENPFIGLLNWILGGRISDTLLYRRERATIEKHFISHGLTNALRGKVTHPFSHSQLDHILFSHSFSLKNTEVLPDSIGSDHHPIRVEIE